MSYFIDPNLAIAVTVAVAFIAIAALKYGRSFSLKVRRNGIDLDIRNPPDA